jgi:hypothetical protein
MRQISDSIKELVGGVGTCVFDGQVETVNPSAGTVSVTIQPHGAIVEGLPYFSPLSTGPWKWLALPKAGATVKVVASDPAAINADTAYVAGCMWDEDDLPPSGYASGDVLLAHDNGTARLLLKASGDIEIMGGQVLLGDSAALALCNQNLKNWADSVVSSLNAQMALITAHTHATLAPDPTFIGTLGAFSAPIAALTTKVKAT